MRIAGLERLVESALFEDHGHVDPMTEALADSRVVARIVCEENAVFCGGRIVEVAYGIVSKDVEVEVFATDGGKVSAGDVISVVRGPAWAVLRGERVVLNFIQRLSGISTLTRKFVDEIQGTRAKICDTRKTTPLMRALEKYAVRCGGGVNHRFSLSDGVLIKENAIRVFGSISRAVSAVRECSHHLLKIEVEVETLEQLDEAMRAGADAVLLDNMSPGDVRSAVEMAGGKVILEASGGITLENVREFAETGVDLISVGALTHSHRSVSMTMEVEA